MGRRKYNRIIYKKLPKWFRRIGSDSAFIRTQYFLRHKERLNLSNPVSFTEKVQWLKLHHRNPLMKKLTDKYDVREYVKDKGLGHLLNELYFVKDSIEPSDLDGLKKPYVLKCTHGSGQNVICIEGDGQDAGKICRKMKKWLKHDHYLIGREWSYKDIKPRIICEKYLSDEKEGQLLDYKFYCCDGEPHLIIVCMDRFSKIGLQQASYDADWNRIDVRKHYPITPREFDKPECLEEMKEICRTLAGDFPVTRVDLYCVDGKIIFGELTFYPDNGLVPFRPLSYNKSFGELIRLREWNPE